MKLKTIAPIYWRYFKIQRKSGISVKAALSVATISFLFSMLSSTLTVLIVANTPILLLFLTAVLYYTTLLFSVKVMAFAQTFGKIILVIFSALGYVVGVTIF